MSEALRLLRLSQRVVSSFYDTEPVAKYLKQKESNLVFQYIDKGVCLIGLPVFTEEEPYLMVEESIIQILEVKKEFVQELKNLTIDTRVVNLD